MGHNHSQMRLSRGLWFGGIQSRLAAVILLAMAPLIGFRIIELKQEREHQIEAAGLRAREVARHAAELYRAPVVEAQALLQVLALVPEVAAGSAESCAAFLERAGRGRSWAQSFWVIDRSGRVVCTTVPQGLGNDVSDRDYVRRPIETGEFMVSDVFVGRARGTLTSMAALPVRDGDGQVTRVISVALRLSWLGRLAADIGSEHGASVRLIDGRGTLFARYPEPAAHTPASDESELVGKALAASDGVAEIAAPDGSRRIYGFVQIPGTQARIAIGFDRAQVLAKVDGEIREAAVALVLATLLAALAGAVLARGIVRPLKLLTAGAEAARSVGAASLPPVRGYAEVTSLATSLAALLADRARREEALKAARREAVEAEHLARSAHAHLSDALAMLPEGVAIFDAEDRLVLWNQRLDDFYAGTAAVRRPGVRFAEIISASIAAGDFAGSAGCEQALLAERLALRVRPESSHERQLADGRWLRVEERSTADGGRIGVHVDITDLKRREASFRLLFDSNPVPMWVYRSRDLRFVAVNDAAVAHYGYSREQFLAMTLLDLRPPEEHAELIAHLRRRPPAQSHIARHRKADGREIAVTIYAQPLTYGGEVGALVAAVDVTERRRVEEELRSTRSFLDTVIENLPTMLFVKDARDDRFVLINRAGEDLLGARRQEVIGRHSHDLFPAAEADRFIAHDRKVIETGELDVLDETEMHTPGNGTRTLRIKKIAVPDEQGRPQYVLGICEDITERKRSEARLSHMARHDALTGLPNRVLFRERLARALDRGSALAVLYVDLDAFKDVNDALGHPIGDALLRLVAERLRAIVREVDTVARLGGDEFAIVAAGGAAEAASALARAIIDLLSEPYQVEGQDVVIGASVGIALAPADGEDADRLLKNADMALFQAKADGRATWRFFDPGMEARQQSRRSIELDLRAALPNRQFTIHYQPAIDLATSMITGFEALLRWQHPERGMIAPDEFIPLAEDIGFIVPLGEWVLRQACEEAVHWPDHVRVAVNLSAAQFRSRNLVQTVVMALAASGLPPRRLELEITETVLLRENDANLAVLHQLRGLGVRIALDDFGTGYSSLSYLRSFPFDKIKIDRSFVRDLPDNPGCRTIIRSVAELASGLGMVTTAEGVETLHQMNELRAEGCTEAQGFLFSPPRPASQVREILTKFRGAIEAAA